MLFCAALSLALIKRSKGRKLLLVEADQLDEENFESVLKALEPCKKRVEALVIATARVQPVASTKKWNVIDI